MAEKLFTHIALKSSSFKKLSGFIENNLGIKMPETKKIMLESRLQKRLKFLNYASFEDYLDFLFTDKGIKEEYPRLIDAVTTNKTDFYREPNHFDMLEKVISSSEYLKNKNHINIWSAAASTGEEPYTIAIVMEEFRKKNLVNDYSLLATDISEEVLQKALVAVYSEERIMPVPRHLLNQYFLRSKDKTKKTYRIKPFLRNKIAFKTLNLLSNYRLEKKMDIVFCRNVLIYFDRERQKQVLQKIMDNMSVEGALFLGHSETLAGMGLKLENLGATVYRKGR
jgi:chemotaxis protein methyltransferase CheR